MSQVKHHSETKAEKKGNPPESVVGEAGSAKRNIIRKGGKGKVRKEGAAGHLLEDGTTYDSMAALDHNDPNYDSEDDADAYIPSDYAEVGRAKLKLYEYKKLIEPVISEFFVSGEIDEVLGSLIEIDVKEYSYEFVKRIINASFDKGDRERESVSQLLSQGYPNVFSTNIVGKGFERLFELVDEIEKDAPNARDMLSKYLARAVVDEILPPSFLSDAVISNLGGDIVEHAKRMLSRDHSGALIEKGWGPGDGRPVEELKIAIDQLIEEYILSSDINEATRCIKELDVPLFHYEIVKRMIATSMDHDKTKQLSISTLLQHLHDTGYMTSSQLMKGFQKLYTSLTDIQLDIPHADVIANEFVTRAKQVNILPHDYEPTVSSTSLSTQQ